MRFSCISCALLAAFAIPAVALAQTETFTVAGGGNTLTFNLPANPIPTSSGTGFFEISSVPVSFNDTSTIDNVSFYTSDNGGGFGDNFFGDPYGAQFFTGDVSNPTFAPGTYDFSDDEGGPIEGTVTISYTREPSSIFLFGTGAFGLAGVTLRRRRE